MMHYTFDQEKKNVYSVWLHDVSYRIVRFEELFPELIGRIKSREHNYSIWSIWYWQAAFSDLMLAMYCLPETQEAAGKLGHHDSDGDPVRITATRS
jgi:hypothetical protein